MPSLGKDQFMSCPGAYKIGIFLFIKLVHRKIKTKRMNWTIYILTYWHRLSYYLYRSLLSFHIITDSFYNQFLKKLSITLNLLLFSQCLMCIYFFYSCHFPVPHIKLDCHLFICVVYWPLKCFMGLQTSPCLAVHYLFLE